MLQAIVLGLIQGLTEFLPVSSSGHLVVVPYLLAWDQPPLAFDVALHGGTLLALLVYFAGDVWYLATRPLGIGVVGAGEARRARRTLLLLAVATAPAALVGALLGTAVEEAFARPRLVGGLLLVTAALLYAAERAGRRVAARAELAEAAAAEPGSPRSADAPGSGEGSKSPGRAQAPGALAVAAHPDDVGAVGRDEATVGVADALLVGCAQALAVLPGISRSGATIAGGMFRGLSRPAAARFSFLMAIPIIAGATASRWAEFTAHGGTGPFSPAEILVGVAVAAVSGYWAIRFLLRVVATSDLLGFARYVAVFGVLTLVARVWLGPPGSV